MTISPAAKPYAFALVLFAFLLSSATYSYSWWRAGGLFGTFSDLQALWTAGHLLWAGVEPALLYEPAFFNAQVARLTGSEDLFLWLYPPYLLPLAAIVALVEYHLAFAVWILASLCTLPILARAAAVPWPTALMLVAFPASLQSALMGQSSGFLALAMGLGLLTVDRRPLVAGLLFSIVCLKPHLAIIIPIYLSAERRWRALIAFCAVGAVLLISPALLSAPSIWLVFLDAIETVGAMSLNSSWGAAQPSIYAALVKIGVSRELALALHALVALFWILFLVWRLQRPADFAVRAGLIAFSTLSVSPYLFAHDLVLLSLPVIGLLTRRKSIDSDVLVLAASLFVWFFTFRLLVDFPGIQLLSLPLGFAYFWLIDLKFKRSDSQPIPHH